MHVVVEQHAWDVQLGHQFFTSLHTKLGTLVKITFLPDSHTYYITISCIIYKPKNTTFPNTPKKPLCPKARN